MHGPDLMLAKAFEGGRLSGGGAPCLVILICLHLGAAPGRRLRLCRRLHGKLCQREKPTCNVCFARGTGVQRTKVGTAPPSAACCIAGAITACHGAWQGASAVHLQAWSAVASKAYADCTSRCCPAHRPLPSQLAQPSHADEAPAVASTLVHGGGAVPTSAT